MKHYSFSPSPPLINGNEESLMVQHEVLYVQQTHAYADYLVQGH